MIPTVGSVEPAPILVLAVGNQLLSDDGVGMVLLDELSRGGGDYGGRVEFVDGGTQGLALLGQLAGREAVIVLDAVALGAAPGALHLLEFPFPHGACGSTSAHEANALELLRFAALLGQLPARVVVVGIEPETLTTGIGLSDAVSAAVPASVQQIKGIISEVMKETQDVSCCAR